MDVFGKFSELDQVKELAFRFVNGTDSAKAPVGDHLIQLQLLLMGLVAFLPGREWMARTAMVSGYNLWCCL